MLEKTERVGLRLPPSLWKTIRKMAIDRGESAASLVRKVLAVYIEEQKEKQ